MAINIKTKSLQDTFKDTTAADRNKNTLPPSTHAHILTYYTYGDGHNNHLVKMTPIDIIDTAFSLYDGLDQIRGSIKDYNPRLSYSIGCVDNNNMWSNRFEEMATWVDSFPILTGAMQTTTVQPIYGGTVIQSRIKDTIVHQTLFNGASTFTRSVEPSKTVSYWDSTVTPVSWNQVYWSTLTPAQQQNDSNRINGGILFYYASMNGWTTLCKLDTTSSNDVIIGALGIQNRNGKTLKTVYDINNILDVCKDKGLPIKNRETGGFMKVSSNGVDGYVISELCMRPKTLTLSSIKVGTPVSYVMTLNGATSRKYAIKEVPQYYDLAYINSKLTYASLIAEYASVNFCGLGSTYLSGSHTIDDIITGMGWTMDGQSLSAIYTSYGKETALYYLYSMFYSCAANRYRLYDTYSNSDVRVIIINDTQTSYEAIMLRCDTGKLTYVATSSGTPKHSYIKPMTAFVTFSFYSNSSGSMNAYIFPEGTWHTVIPNY